MSIKANPNMEAIFNDVYTTEDMHSLYKEMDQCITLLFKTEPSVESAFNSSFNTQRKNSIMSFLKKQGIDLASPGKIQEAFQEVKKAGKTFPVVTLKLGYEPTINHLETFSAWFMTRLGKKVMLEILPERNILGGAYITYNGFFKDYSLKSKLKNVFKEKHFTKKNNQTFIQ